MSVKSGAEAVVPVVESQPLIHGYSLLMTGIRQLAQGAKGDFAGQSLWITLLLVVLMASSALGVVYASHQTRSLVTELKEQKVSADAYQMEWGQLLLEQSTWSTPARIESEAVSQLNMMVPQAGDIVIARDAVRIK